MRLKFSIYLTLVLALGTGAWLALKLAASLPEQDGRYRLPALTQPAVVIADRLGIPSVEASGRQDAFRVLGFLHARDRLFQMELMRRKTAGRLAELFGEKALPLDLQQRAYRFETAAHAIVQALPEAQRATLKAYVAGVNAIIQGGAEPPPEFLALGTRPEPWREEDSLLVALGMFQTLSGEEKDERMLSVMEQALPPEVVAFLTPDSDEYAVPLLGGKDSQRPPRPVPAQALAALSPAPLQIAGGVDSEAIIAGSNNWAVAGSKTGDGRAILANDMHLSLGIPNIWYRAALNYDGHSLVGLTLPGVPMLVAGSNGDVAWGFTNIDADVLDLVKLEIKPDDPDQYLTPWGWRRFEHHTETIQVKNGSVVAQDLRSTLWGPVSPKPLLGSTVAIRWVALDPAGVDLGLMDMDRVRSVIDGISVLTRSGGPHQNVLLADRQGRIAWTYMGRFPARRGFDGAVSRPWSDGKLGWDGYLPPEELPRLTDPAEGFLATANNRTLGRDYPHVIGHNYAHGYRAYRISQRLRALSSATELSLLDVQLDTRSEFYDYWRDLALRVTGEQGRNDPALRDAEQAIEAWDGKMDAGSLGIGLLVRFRQQMAEAVFAPVVARCRTLDPDFGYAWREMETPLRAMLDRRAPETLPSSTYNDWSELLRSVLKASVADLKLEHGVTTLMELPWGKINRIAVRHPISNAAPWLSWLLDMPAAESSGCATACVRILGNGHGASERLVVSPSDPGSALLHMPGGQSGHPLSPNYGDQQAAWQFGFPLPFLAGTKVHRLELAP
ncbi:penicillin acylase family protein [Methyloterricola oryzae]|uniref:penicillin acylase family protein n=1 Tax=Methyloterricola oryzae TaxID=1495050 RepID=UPI0005EBC8E1|nr:penicillin acylase family protein [Methyloterricola oryzae]